MPDVEALETEIYFLLRKHVVRLHYRASGTGARYAVFAHGEQISEPKAHAEAVSDRDRLTAADVTRLLVREHLEGGR